MSRIQPNRLCVTVVGAVAATGLILASCGTDDNRAADDEFCRAFSTVATDQGPDVDFESASEEEIGTALEAYAESFVPKLQRLRDLAPDEAGDAARVYTGTFEEILATADDSAFDEEHLVAEHALVEAAIVSCGTDVVDIVAVDYAFQGVAASVSPGWVALRLDNRGGEFHEAVVYRRPQGATESAMELISVDDNEQSAKLEFVGVTFVPPDSQGGVLLDLAEGEYIIVCQLPVGMTTMDSEADGPAHSTNGMVTEFSVG